MRKNIILTHFPESQQFKILEDSRVFLKLLVFMAGSILIAMVEFLALVKWIVLLTPRSDLLLIASVLFSIAGVITFFIRGLSQIEDHHEAS